ncbi:MAG: hypothetical protein U0T81_09205 [Saprospiraceae bacterium]
MTKNQLAIIQGVGYPSFIFSHFRASDIWVSGSDAKEDLNSGWLGRYVNYEYPNYPVGFPNPTMPDPPAIRIGSMLVLVCRIITSTWVFPSTTQ